MDKINIDFVICEICKKSFLQITSKHLKKHNLTISQYKQLYPNACIRYCGNGQYWVTFLNKKHKNPDFKIHNKLAVIELFGTHWHTIQEANYIIQQYELINYKCLIIWDTELQNTNLVIEKIMSFLSII